MSLVLHFRPPPDVSLAVNEDLGTQHGWWLLWGLLAVLAAAQPVSFLLPLVLSVPGTLEAGSWLC